MKGENVVGALVAALLCFMTALSAAMFENGAASITELTHATWISLIAGTLTAFWKDYQALAVRRWSSEKVLGTETHYPKEKFPRAYGLPEGDPSTTEKRVDDES